MDSRPIMDAGPGLNFFSIHKERLLISVLGPLHIPQTVEGEILRKARSDPRFAPAETVIRKLPAKYLAILPDTATDELVQAVTRISGTPFHQRLSISRDLGEMMVIAHAVVAAEAGADIIVLIDEGNGRRIAGIEQRRLARLRSSGQDVGSISLVNTETVLKRAVSDNLITGKAEMRSIYQRLRELDDGLMPIGETGLLSAHLWQK
ncbi:hypothetical protein HF851_09460 [Corynebacterium ammoniagenes]|nr:hypothetical protein [Corynebacterium ammoniagenes]NMF32498.1 hypothetical protein [Corynebacterium ammoniagenes]